MIPRKQYLHLARVVLENRTGLSLVTGHPDHGFDSVLVRDANGLPTIPGTALAGVLRHQFEALRDKEAGRGLFGYQDGDRGMPSRLQISWACLLDQHGQAIFGLQLDPGWPHGDRVLEAALAADVQRKRVRINHRGVAMNTGHFDRAILPAGHRFAVELTIESDLPEDPALDDVLGLLAGPGFFLGGGTRSGMGHMELVRCHCRTFDLQSTDAAAAFRELSPDPGAVDGLKHYQPEARVLPGRSAARLSLRCEDYYRFGGDAAMLPDGLRAQELADVDLLPQFEPVLIWPDGGKAQLEQEYALIPGASVKGAMAHRFAFYYNALSGVFADDLDAAEIGHWDKTKDSPGVRALFGYVEAEKSDDKPAAAAGCLYVEDARIRMEAGELQKMMHVAVDVFTGGARHGMLFDELVLHSDQPVEITLRLDQTRLARACQREGVDESQVQNALRRTLEDLCQGLLPLGAGGGRGYGIFTGSLQGQLTAGQGEVK